jgi:hypothetical protein
LAAFFAQPPIKQPNLVDGLFTTFEINRFRASPVPDHSSYIELIWRTVAVHNVNSHDLHVVTFGAQPDCPVPPFALPDVDCIAVSIRQ